MLLLSFSNVCFHGDTVWWVKPYYLSLSYFLWRCQILLISKIFLVPTRRQYVVIGSCDINKCCFIGWNNTYSFWNVIWQCFDDIRQMVWTDIDISRCVVRFLIRLVFSGAKIECNIQEINCYEFVVIVIFRPKFSRKGLITSFRILSGAGPVETYVLNSIYFPKKR